MNSRIRRTVSWSAALLLASLSDAATAPGSYWIETPPPGARALRVVTPNVLELELIQAKNPDPAKLPFWGFSGIGDIPVPARFEVTADNAPMAVASVGFRRRVVYAPLAARDLRVGTWIYLVLASPLRDGQAVAVRNPDATVWPVDWTWTATADPMRLSTAIHVNQVGYEAGFPKSALVGAYLGSLGELAVDSQAGFEVVDASTGAVAVRGPLRPRPDAGFTYVTYQRVLEADFSGLQSPGEYRLRIPGLGASLPFTIGDGAAASFARTFALGLYAQRCGGSNAMPFTRFVHDACHLAPARIPTGAPAFGFTWATIANYAATINTNNPAQSAPRLDGPAAQRFPFVNQGTVDVSGGHHDAGDYSKYTTNSASLVHLLMFAVDSLPGVADLDNLGIPESGDGISDVMQEAKWESDFLAKMQDADGGFYFLVYPLNREYENNVLPDHGDPQVVWPKTTSATAAAVAALAEAASSPRFKTAWPGVAAAYLEKAKLGWKFLDAAIAKYGKAGAYQKITHYGDDYAHDDELAWAAAAMYVATGDPAYQQALLGLFDPSSPATWRWGWIHANQSWGNAERTYAFAARSGRLASDRLDPVFLGKCEAQLLAAGDDQLRWSRQSAYGTSFPAETKRFRSGGWYFPTDAAFDLAVAYQFDEPPLNDPRPKYLAAMLSNLGYAAGANPVDVSYVTGLGWKRPREIVSQLAQNDRRALPPPGLLIGSVQAGYSWVDLYKGELGAMSFPSDGDNAAPYAVYDRWSDAFNVTTEAVVTDQARALAATAWLMARTPKKNQPWSPGTQTLTPAETAAPGSRLVSESGGPAGWVESELTTQDGRRVFSVSGASAAGVPAPSDSGLHPLHRTQPERYYESNP